jgi:hypothetical protein
MKRYTPVILLLASAAVLSLGIIRLFVLRFEAGDVYPEYSSLRSDPLGTMAFYESLTRFPNFSISRDFSTVNTLPDSRPDTTYLHLATSQIALQAFSEETLRDIERFGNAGGRLVITMFPVAVPASRSFDFSPPKPKEAPKPAPYRERWGLDLAVVSLEQFDNTYLPAIVENVSGLDLPETLDWHSGIVFRNLHADWKPIYVRGTEPVIVERQFGRGSVLIATDSFFLSNEAMLLDRHSDLLAFLIGSNRNVVFDEAHLGVTESPSMATLMRRYRLHWVGASLLLLAVLFIWKMSTPLVPARTLEQVQDYVAGKDASTGVINLLRRSIPAGKLLETCFNEWKKSAAQGSGYSAARIQQAEAAFLAENSNAAKDRNVIAAYRTISTILQKRIQ